MNFDTHICGLTNGSPDQTNFAKMDLNATFLKAPISCRIVDKHSDFGLSFMIRTQTAKSRRC